MKPQAAGGKGRPPPAENTHVCGGVTPAPSRLERTRPGRAPEPRPVSYVNTVRPGAGGRGAPPSKVSPVCPSLTPLRYACRPPPAQAGPFSQALGVKAVGLLTPKTQCGGEGGEGPAGVTAGKELALQAPLLLPGSGLMASALSPRSRPRGHLGRGGPRGKQRASQGTPTFSLKNLSRTGPRLVCPAEPRPAPLGVLPPPEAGGRAPSSPPRRRPLWRVHVCEVLNLLALRTQSNNLCY